MCPDKESVPNITAYHPKAIDHADSQLILTKHLFTGDMSNLTMKEYIRKNAPFLGDILTIENLSEFMNFEISKLILFTEKTFVPLTFRALSSKFNGRLEFGVVLEKNEELSERFNVSSYPTLILIHGTD